MNLAIVSSKGDLFRSLLTGIVFTIIILYCATYATPIVTQLTGQVVYKKPDDTEIVTFLVWCLNSMHGSYMNC